MRTPPRSQPTPRSEAGVAVWGPWGHGLPPSTPRTSRTASERQAAQRSPPRATGRGAPPEVLGGDHLGVVHDLALVRGDLQGGQHVVHAGQAGGGTRGHAVELPLQDVEARPPRHMGALQRVRQRRLRGLPSQGVPQGPGVLGAVSAQDPSRSGSAGKGPAALVQHQGQCHPLSECQPCSRVSVRHWGATRRDPLGCPPSGPASGEEAGAPCSSLTGEAREGLPHQAALPDGLGRPHQRAPPP